MDRAGGAVAQTTPVLPRPGCLGSVPPWGAGGGQGAGAGSGRSGCWGSFPDSERAVGGRGQWGGGLDTWGLSRPWCRNQGQAREDPGAWTCPGALAQMPHLPACPGRQTRPWDPVWAPRALQGTGFQPPRKAWGRPRPWKRRSAPPGSGLGPAGGGRRGGSRWPLWGGRAARGSIVRPPHLSLPAAHCPRPHIWAPRPAPPLSAGTPGSPSPAPRGGPYPLPSTGCPSTPVYGGRGAEACAPCKGSVPRAPPAPPPRGGHCPRTPGSYCDVTGEMSARRCKGGAGLRAPQHSAGS